MHPAAPLLRAGLGLALLSATIVATPGPAAQAGIIAPRPMNVLFVGSDDQTPDSIAKMPYLSSILPDMVDFTEAHAQDDTCCTARAQWMTGQSALHNGVTNNSLGGRLDNTQTLAVWMKRAGYRTGLFGKYLNGYGTVFGRGLKPAPGWDTWDATIGTDQEAQYDYDIAPGDGTLTHYGTAAADYKVNVEADMVDNFISAHQAGSAPWFAYWTPTATHSPWTASPPDTGLFTGAYVPHPPDLPEADIRDKPAWVHDAPPVDQAKQDADRRKEWAGAVSVDDGLRQVDQLLHATGQASSTILIYAGDNGYAFGEHRWTTKLCEYNECSHVPLMVRYPGQAGRQVTVPVSSVDLASTITGLTGASAAILQDGTSFGPLVTDPATPAPREILLHWAGGDGYGRSGTTGSLPSYWGVRSERWKYVELGTGETELYDEREDPYELRNVAGTPACAQVQATLAHRLAELKHEAGGDGAPDRADHPNGLAPPTLDSDGLAD